MSHDPLTGEADRFPGAPHPREQALLVGHLPAEETFLAAWRSGRIHHAWLLGGAEGIGKATFAYRAARFVLSGGATDRRDLSVATDDPTFRKVAALSHPDLAVVRRTPATDKKGPSAEIRVDTVRDVIARFASTAGAGGWRVGIVDAADDLNASGANALLKLIEEPPARTIFFIVAHRPGRLLPTIRSRCTRLMFNVLATDDVVQVVRSLGGGFARLDDDVVREAAALSGGSVRDALRRTAPETIALVRTVQAMLARLPSHDIGEVLGLAETLAGRDAEDDFAVAIDEVGAFIRRCVEARAGQGAARLAPLVEVWDKAARSVREAEAYNLDRRPLVLSLFSDLADALRA